MFDTRGSIALSLTPDLGGYGPSSRTRCRPTTLVVWVAIGCVCFAAGFLSRSAPHPSTLLPPTLVEKTNAFLPSSFAHSVVPSSRRPHNFRPASRSAPLSCRLCDSDPTNQLCEYGDSAIRLSRAYEGSGLRVKRFLEKALRGEKVKIGVIGASVTVGHGLGGHPTWVQRWFEGFQEQFPNSELMNGAIPAMTSRFYSYCVDTMVPEPADLYLIELDINDNIDTETFVAVDNLFRTLLDQPHQPAVIRLSVLAISFPEMIRGTSASLINSQFFDVPVISLRNMLLPLTIAHPDLAPNYFTELVPGSGWPDYRHIGPLGHDALADMITHYLYEQTCLAQQEARRPRLQPKKGSPWPTEDVFEMVPRLHLWEQWSETGQAAKISPVCNFASSTQRPLVPLPSNPDGSEGPAWERFEWNDKAALAGSVVGSVAKFAIEGTSAGVFVWQHAGGKHLPAAKQPGQASCWIDDQVSSAITVDAYSPYEAAMPAWIMVHESLEEGKHILSCKILESSSTTGHEVRLMGVVSH
ncbi:hypothetical protein JCM8097_002290 [Rhodosporidiobolus ruineniae]